MTFTERDKKLALVLKSDLQLLKKSVEVLMYSYDQCKNLSEKAKKTPEKQERVEALTARFSGTTDLLTQKIIKTILILLKEDLLTFIDRVNFLEKLEVIQEAQTLINIRSLRNEIAHEYSSDLSGLFDEVIVAVPELKEVIDAIMVYIQESFPFKSLLE